MFHDPWITAIPLARSLYIINYNAPEDKMVYDLIIDAERVWDRNLMEASFGGELGSLVLSMAVPLGDYLDNFI